jgi:hypothetical protein
VKELPDLLLRYKAATTAADAVGVWSAIGEFRMDELGVHTQGEVYDVLDETMARQKHNVELVTQRLLRMGYKPFWNLDMYRLATDKSIAHCLALDKLVGGLPESVKSFYRTFEYINFMGDLPPLCFHAEGDGLEGEMSDPLVIGAAVEVYTELSDLAEMGDLELPLTSPIVLPTAPDLLHKHGYSGGEPIGIVVPDARIEGRWSEPDLAFIEYLRVSILEWGGFPGFATAESVPPEIDELRRDLVPF